MTCGKEVATGSYTIPFVPSFLRNLCHRQMLLHLLRRLALAIQGPSKYVAVDGGKGDGSPFWTDALNFKVHAPGPL